jgi:prepilin-type processing-associated H-X9-DG protein
LVRRECHRRSGTIATKRASGFGLVELIIVIGLVTLMAGLLLPAIQSAREAARRMQCGHQLRQVGLGLLGFEAAYRVFPASGWTRASRANPSGAQHGWRASLLPFLDAQSLAAPYRVDVHWWSPENATVVSQPIPLFRCPSMPSNPLTRSAIANSVRPSMVFSMPLEGADYEALQGVQPKSFPMGKYDASNRFAILHRNSETRFRDVTDGSSSTIAVVEAAGRPTVYRLREKQPGFSNDQGIGWADSEGAFSLDGSSRDGLQEGCTAIQGCTCAVNCRNDNEPWSMHPGGCHAIFADGHLQWLDESIDLGVLASMATRSASD